MERPFVLQDVEKDFAIEWKLEPPQIIIGVYFLIQDSEIVYVGQSTNVMTRLLQHKNKEWNGWFCVECDMEELTCLEDHYILKFLPKYNKTIFSTDKIPGYTPFKNIKKVYSQSFQTFRKEVKKNHIDCKKINGKTYYCLEDFKKTIYGV
jgi:hypothetical protein